MSYEPTIKDRVRIALAFLILENKEVNEEPSTCILRFRHRLKARQDETPSKPDLISKDNETKGINTAYEAKIAQMQDEISELTKRLAEREADLSTVFADLEATTAKPPPKKRQKKLTPTPLTNITNQPVTRPLPPDEAEKTGQDAGQTEGLSVVASVKKKVMAKPRVEGKGVDKDEHPVLVMCRKLDESLDATIKSSLTMNTASLLVKLFQSPKDIGQTFLPLRLEAILLHAKDLIKTLSIHLMAAIDAANNPRSAHTKKGLVSKIKFPKQVIQVVIGLSHVILTTTTTCVTGILKDLEGFPEFDLSRLQVEWMELIVSIGTTTIKPTIKAIDEITRKIAEEHKKEREKRFGTSSHTTNETQNTDIRQVLVKLLISLARIDLDLQMSQVTTWSRMSRYPLSEIVAFGAMTALVKLFDTGAIADKPPTSGLVSAAPEKGTVEALIVVIRSCIPYLTCLEPSSTRQASKAPDHANVASMLDAYKTVSNGSPGIGARGSPNLLLGMTIRTKLVHLLSPIVEPISNSLLGFFSAPNECNPQSGSTLKQDPAIKESLLRLMEELMWAEGEEQGGLGDWLLEMVGQGNQQEQIEDMDGVEHVMQSMEDLEAEGEAQRSPEAILIEPNALSMNYSAAGGVEDQETTHDDPTSSGTPANQNTSLTNDLGSDPTGSVAITTEACGVPVAELVDFSTIHPHKTTETSDSSSEPRLSGLNGQDVFGGNISLLY